MDNGPKIFPCPVCGSIELDGEGTDDTCMVCGWEDSVYQRIYPDETGPNLALTLNEARRRWEAGETLYKSFPNPKSAQQ